MECRICLFFLNSTTKSQCFLFTFPTYLMCRNNLLLLFSCSVVSDSLQHHGLQHARLPVLHYLLKFAQTHIHWVSDATQLSHPLSSPFSSCLQSFPASGSFPMSQLFASGGQSFGASVLASVLPVNIQGWFPLGLTGLISLQSKGLSRVFFSTTFKSINPLAFSLLYGPILTSVHDYCRP